MAGLYLALRVYTYTMPGSLRNTEHTHTDTHTHTHTHTQVATSLLETVSTIDDPVRASLTLAENSQMTS